MVVVVVVKGGIVWTVQWMDGGGNEEARLFSLLCMRCSMTIVILGEAVISTRTNCREMQE